MKSYIVPQNVMRSYYGYDSLSSHNRNGNDPMGIDCVRTSGKKSQTSKLHGVGRVLVKLNSTEVTFFVGSVCFFIAARVCTSLRCMYRYWYRDESIGKVSLKFGI